MIGNTLASLSQCCKDFPERRWRARVSESGRRDAAATGTATDTGVGAQFAYRVPLCRVAMPPTVAETLRAWLLSALVVHGAVAGNPDAKRLYDDLLSNYNKLVRPVVNTSDVLRVCIKLKLSQLIDV
ncbi:PREDICTED: acetylcholine receptor subunit alpha-L1-like, partial [Nicrophorus vespilloides]|uniref:Acetylcholine receptor subunit alpha-L1-like n=1 Tax=Nicrophorus vespilloides TaxID=110193 RepID=A0ABM1MHS8_NICVS